MRSKIIWEVRAKNPPLVKRSCNRCSNNSFYCSEKFRINAQKKNIDVWLIYKCIKCDSTYNMTILHRTKTESISKDLLNKFLKNDLKLAWEYAFSQEIARKNNVKLDYKSVEYSIDYNNIMVTDILKFEDEVVSIKVKCLFDFKLRLSSIIRMCLNLSANQLNQLIEAKVIFVKTQHLQKKHKINNQVVFQVNIQELREYL